MPKTVLGAGAQELFTITASNIGEGVKRGTYTFEFAGKSIQKAAFSCP